MESLGKRRLVELAVLFFLLLQACSSKYVITSSKYTHYDGEVNHHTCLVRATRARVFDILTQEEAFKKLCPKGTRITHVSPPPYQAGTLIKTNIDHIFKLEWNKRVEEVIPDTKIRLVFLDGFFSGGTEIWELRDEGEHTRVSHTLIVKPKGILKKLAWVLKVRRKHDKMVESFLDNLKTASEKHLRE